MKIYISGKISDLPMEEVRAKFAQAEQQIEAFGHTPVNPLNNGQPEDASWEKQMTASLGLLLESDAIYMLHDWKDSRGARIECAVAAELGIEIIHQPQYGYYESKLNKR